MTRLGTSSAFSSLCLRYLSHNTTQSSGPGWEWGAGSLSKEEEDRAVGVQLQGVALTTQPASFQGNRDESTNVDMSLVQRDVQVSDGQTMYATWAS